MGHFLPFYSNENPENQNFEKMKQTPRDIILHLCTIKDNHMMYGSWVMEHDTEFVNLGHFLPFYFPNSPKNQNFEKMKKKTPRKMIILHMCTKNYDHMIFGSWDMVCNGWTDGQIDWWTNGKKKWHTEVGAPPNNFI